MPPQAALISFHVTIRHNCCFVPPVVLETKTLTMYAIGLPNQLSKFHVFSDGTHQKVYLIFVEKYLYLLSKNSDPPEIA